MIGHPPISPLFPSTPLSLSLSSTPPWPTRGTRHAMPYLLSYVLPVIAGRPLRATPRAARELVLHDLTPGERSEEHTSELQSRQYLVCRLLLEKKKKQHP